MTKHLHIYKYISLFTGFLVMISIMLPILRYDETAYLGYEVIAGTEILTINPFNLGIVARAWLPFSWLAMIAFILPFISGLFVLLDKKYVLIGIILSVISLFLMILLPDQVDILYSIGNSNYSQSVNWEMGFGLIIAILYVFIGLLSQFYVFTVYDILKLKST